MKRFFIPAILLASSLSWAALIPAKTFQFDFTQSDLNPADLTVEFEVRCSHKVGLFFPESKSCGTKNVPVKISADGKLTTAAVEAFKNIPGAKLDNYRLDLIVSRGDQHILSLAARGKDQIRSWLGLRSSVKVLRLKGGILNIHFQGQDILGSPWAQKPEASLAILISGEEPITAAGFYIHSLTAWSSSLGASNRGYTKPEKQLRNTKQILAEDSYYATTSSLETLKLSVFAIYESEPGPSALKAVNLVKVPLTEEGLALVPTLELKEK